MIKKMKSDCEAITISRHVMCPNTYICIKQDWLCGEFLKLVTRCDEVILIAFQMVMMIVTTSLMKHIVEQEQTVLKINSNV